MTDYAVLEIGLHSHDARFYGVDAIFKRSREDAGRRRMAEIPRFDLNALDLNRSDPETHGPMLTRALFATEPLRLFLNSALVATMSQSPPVPLRLRLFVGPTLPELHTLCWETLRDPARPDALLALDQNVLFSRYLSSADWRQVQPLSRAELNALVVIANPGDLPRYQMAPVDVSGELARAREGLGDIPLQALCRPESPTDHVVGQPTREQLLDRLREGCEILFLVAHGKLYDGDPMVWLEASDGSTHRVPAGGPDGLVTRLAQLQQLPRLVVLASCQSAGSGGRLWSSTDDGALSSLGPRLAEIGVPAVVAMQDNVAMDTVKGFMPAFFKELQASGQIDRAVAVARGTVRDRHDWWVPVLYTRLESGRLFTPEVEVETGAQAGSGSPEAEGYDLRVVRELLLAGFSTTSLRRMLRYSGNRQLRGLVSEFSPSDGLTVLIDKTLDYCERELLVDALLAEVERENPRQYARFEPRLTL